MSKLRRSTLILVLLSMFLVAALYQRTVRGRDPDLAAVFPDHLASRLIGREVENDDGQELAKVSDLLVDLRRGRVEHVILCSGGILGLGQRLKAVPWEVISVGTTKRNVLALDINKPRWEGAPVFHSHDGLRLARPSFAASLDRYYRQAAKENDSPVRAHNLPSQAPVPVPAAYRPGTSSQPGAPLQVLMFVRDLKGQRVINAQHQPIGRVVDLLLDGPGSGAAYAIISAERLLKRKARFAVPLQRLEVTANHKLVLDASRSTFDRAQPFDTASGQHGRTELEHIFRLDTSPGVPKGNVEPVHDKSIALDPVQGPGAEF